MTFPPSHCCDVPWEASRRDFTASTHQRSLYLHRQPAPLAPRAAPQSVLRVTTMLVASKVPVEGKPIQTRIAPNCRASVSSAGSIP